MLSGGGARGAYEAGVLAYLFERVYPELPRGFEFDIVSGTSVGAIHAAYVAATAGLRGRLRSRALAETWKGMRLGDVVKMRPADLVGVPLRALGLTRLARTVGSGGESAQAVGGLIDLTPLERIVADRIPWSTLRENLKHGRPGALCISCTEVEVGPHHGVPGRPSRGSEALGARPQRARRRDRDRFDARARLGGDPVPLPRDPHRPTASTSTAGCA